MDQKIFQDVPENEREVSLEANCMHSEEKEIQKYYTEEEMVQLRADYAMNSITIRKATEILNMAKDAWKVATKPAADQNEYLIKNIRHGFQNINCQVYIFPDFENRMVGFYDNMGNLLESRRMKPEEAQMYIKQKN